MKIEDKLDLSEDSSLKNQAYGQPRHFLNAPKLTKIQDEEQSFSIFSGQL